MFLKEHVYGCGPGSRRSSVRVIASVSTLIKLMSMFYQYGDNIEKAQSVHVHRILHSISVLLQPLDMTAGWLHMQHDTQWQRIDIYSVQ